MVFLATAGCGVGVGVGAISAYAAPALSARIAAYKAAIRNLRVAAVLSRSRRAPSQPVQESAISSQPCPPALLLQSE